MFPHRRCWPILSRISNHHCSTDAWLTPDKPWRERSYGPRKGAKRLLPQRATGSYFTTSIQTPPKRAERGLDFLENFVKRWLAIVSRRWKNPAACFDRLIHA
jgi:hypothetical protein